MQILSQAKVLKIITPFHYLIQDVNDNSIIKVQLKPTNCKEYQHLLTALSSTIIDYSLQKKGNSKFREEYRKGVIFLDKKDITTMYIDNSIKEYMSEINSQTILKCFVSKVECLKLQLINLENLKNLTFYFSELKLIRLGNKHPKQIWERAQFYFKEQIQGEFIELTVSGSQNYKEEVNIFGQIQRIRDKVNIKERFISDGYAELSKDASKYLKVQKINQYNQIRDKAKNGNKGMWQTSKNISKSNMQVQQFKYKQWQEWIKDYRSITSFKNQEEELKNILEELTKQMKPSKQNNQQDQQKSKLQYNKIKILIDVMMTIFENQLCKRHLKFFQDIIKVFCNILVNCQIWIGYHIDNLDFIKTLNKIMIFLSYYHTELEKLIQVSKGQKILKNGGTDFQKSMKFIFKLCFLGNQTFHEKVFGKKKQSDYQNFNFQSVYLQGISSLSECSDYEQGDKLSKQQKKERKIHSAHQKIRVNATHLLSFLFKHYPNIVELHWQMCVASNIITTDFLQHVKKLKLKAQQTKLSQDQKRQIVNLMRSNFGNHSLILLSIFQKSNKVKINSINCLLNMIANFQGKKLIATTQSSYIEKLLKQTKSSFIPKSFIIFSALRNALYFLLFTLYYEKNLLIIVAIFKTLCQLCNNCSLIDKMSFQQGIGLLMSNYILPVLQFEWTIVQLQELKILCINFLSVLVNNNRRWQQIQIKYFKSRTNNINKKLLQVITLRKSNNVALNEDKLILQILNYFTKLTKRYYSIIFYKINGELSIWNYLSDLFVTNINYQYSQFVEEIFKGHLDQIQLINNQHSKLIESSISKQVLAQFLYQFLKVYTAEVTPNNYLHLIATLTYIDQNYWKYQQFNYAKHFLLHCFYSFTGQQYYHQGVFFPSIEGIKNNALIKIALIKLVGYISFCPQFQTDRITKKSVKLLLELSKQYKSFNSIVKITWGLSNWSKVPKFSTALTEKQLKECLDYMMFHSKSDKQKIASNCTRGIGFFVGNIGKKFDLKDCRKHIIKNLTHNIIKVRTNSTKTLLSLSQDLTNEEVKELVPILELNILKNNYHLQMETLQLMKKLNNPIKGKRLLGLFVTILKNLMNFTTMEYQFSEIKTIRQLRFTVLTQIFNIQEQIKANLDLAKDIIASIYAYLTRDCKEQYQQANSTSNVLDKDFDKSAQAEQLVFNKTKSQGYNEQRIISTQLMSKGFVFRAHPDDLQLITKIKDFTTREGLKMGEQWQKLSGLKMSGNEIMVDFSALQLGEYEEEEKQMTSF